MGDLKNKIKELNNIIEEIERIEGIKEIEDYSFLKGFLTGLFWAKRELKIEERSI